MMIHPSYFELMDVVNKDVPEGGEPIVTSRYSIVLGTAKRARQIVAAGNTTYNGEQRNALSIAVEELQKGEIHILPAGSGAAAEESGETDEAAEDDGEENDEEESEYE